MDEAIEICKLRLFLKMVAQIEDVSQIEPLPDIDFNIQAGNTLVGFATYEEVKNAVMERLDSHFENTMQRIEEKAEDVKVLFDKFREQQTTLGGDVTPADKQELQDKLKELEDELNEYLAKEYGIDPKKRVDYESWLTSHAPFHWFIAFYGILQGGGFDVIIGNPPYVEYSKVKKEYKVIGYETESCGNLYAFTFERSFKLLHQNGWKSMIIPHSAYCTDRMAPLQKLFYQQAQVGWVQTYGERPAQLFVGARPSCAVYIVQQGKKSEPTLYSTRYHKWNERFRLHLFDVIEHISITQTLSPNSIPKIRSECGKNIWRKLERYTSLDRYFTTRHSSHTIYFHNAALYWIRAMDFVPYFWNERDGEKMSTHIKPLYFRTDLDASVVVAALNSSIFYWRYIVLSNCRDLSMREVRNFPIGIDQMETSLKQQLSQLSYELMVDLRRNARRKETNYQTTGRVVYDEFFPRHSKPIIDKIDRVLAQHYGFTDEELDFIINYDIKYRMGLGN